MAFNPNQLTFADGLNRIAKAVDKVGLSVSDRITTSRDPDVREAVIALKVTNVPSGFQKWQLPVSLSGASQMFLTAANPGASVPAHSHDEGNGIRFIISGSIIYDGKELTAGDWMFIPQGKKYSFQVGELGATMAYCYECCCG